MVMFCLGLFGRARLADMFGGIFSGVFRRANDGCLAAPQIAKIGNNGT